MPISMSCPACRKALAAPDSAIGKRAKCPACGQIMMVPGEETGGEIVSPEPPQYSARNGIDPSESGFDNLESSGQVSEADGSSRRPCPECGEMIVSGAAKCRYCDAIFDFRLRQGARGHGQSYSGFSIASMVLGIISVFTACFGIVLGIVGLIFGVLALNGIKQSRSMEGRGMAVAGVILSLLGSVGWTLFYVLIFAYAANLHHIR
jgi:predicted RNA-binding Zn-ribbon protein involved in translation (DUF1610 family)